LGQAFGVTLWLTHSVWPCPLTRRLLLFSADLMSAYAPLSQAVFQAASLESWGVTKQPPALARVQVSKATPLSRNLVSGATTRPHRPAYSLPWALWMGQGESAASALLPAGRVNQAGLLDCMQPHQPSQEQPLLGLWLLCHTTTHPTSPISAQILAGVAGCAKITGVAVLARRRQPVARPGLRVSSPIEFFLLRQGPRPQGREHHEGSNAAAGPFLLQPPAGLFLGMKAPVPRWSPLLLACAP